MGAAFVQIILLGLAIHLAWLAITGLRSGVVTFYPRYTRTEQFSRATKPGAFWTTIIAYLLFAAVVVVSDIVRLVML